MTQAAQYWNQRYQLVPPPVIPTPFGQALAQILREKHSRDGPVLQVLDLGAGTGRDSRVLAETGARVIALDRSNMAVQTLRTIDGVDAVEHDVREALPFEASHFDLIYSHFLLSGDFNDTELSALIEELVRVLKPAGSLHLAVRATNDPTYIQGPQAGAGPMRIGGCGIYFFSQRRLKKLFARWHIQRLALQRYQLDAETYGVLLMSATRAEPLPSTPASALQGENAQTPGNASRDNGAKTRTERA